MDKHHLEVTSASGPDGYHGWCRPGCQRIADADGVPQSFGRPFGLGYLEWFSPWCGFCGAALWKDRRRGIESSGVSGRCSDECGCHRGRFGGDDADRLDSIGYLANAIIGVLKFLSPEEDVKAFVVWGLGSFSRISGDEMVLFIVLMCILLPMAYLLVKPMNLLLLGDRYAANLGLNIRRSRMLVIVSSGVLVAIVTAYCGPIMFIGLAVPHLARAIFRTSDHRILMPATALCGAALALLCNLIARMPGFEGALPVNSVTALVGAPVIAMVLFRRRKDDVGE